MGDVCFPILDLNIPRGDCETKSLRLTICKSQTGDLYWYGISCYIKNSFINPLTYFVSFLLFFPYSHTYFPEQHNIEILSDRVTVTRTDSTGVDLVLP